MSIRDSIPSSKTGVLSSWHSQLRIMDTLCLSMKIVSHHLKQVDASQKKELEKLQTSLQRGLVTFMQKELKANGYVSDIMTETQPDTIGADQDQDQYTFRILYLIQDLLLTLDHTDIHNIAINNSLKIARVAADPFVRAKAFELLAL